MSPALVILRATQRPPTRALGIRRLEMTQFNQLNPFIN